MNAKALEAFPSTIRSVESLITFITRLESCCKCIGNPDLKFKPLIQARKGVFNNAKGSNTWSSHNNTTNNHAITIHLPGTDVVAQVESTILGKPTIRHNSCELLLLSEQATYRCSSCQGHRNSLHVMLGRLQSSRNSADASSHTNYRYLTTVSRTTRMHNLHRSYVLAKRRAMRMKKKVKELMEKDGVQISTAMDGDLKQILKSNFSQIAGKYPANSFHRVFWNQHSQSASCKNARGVRWHPAMIRWCLYLRHLSGKAYETLRNTGVMQLPSQRTLRDYTHYVPATIGFSSQVDQMLLDTLKVRVSAQCPIN